ncbi:ABC transporter permease subunit [Chelatococcus sp. XZ-Ab1]|uniref:ABC transporter permease n=1 Tax=Chelatococcus sp. XZ-Ab1 TaxID=3034027 RepID=UPI0023E43062|nr:ABC transporter permease subunit [Chelatococcus sp. XZ-Ab1]
MRSDAKGVAAWFGRYLWSAWAGATGLLCLAAAWQMAHEIYGAFILPDPLTTLATLADLATEPGFGAAVKETGLRALNGFMLAAGIGAAAGTVAGYSFAALRLMKPVVTFILGVPPISWIVLALIWFGASGGSAVATVVVAALPISFAGALEGVATRDRGLDAMARAFGAGPLRRFRDVTLPHLLSYLFAAWTTAIGTAWKVAVMAELLGNAGGVGGALARARALFDIPQVMALTVLVVLCALGSDHLVLQPLREAAERWRTAGQSGSVKQPWSVRP